MERGGRVEGHLAEWHKPLVSLCVILKNELFTDVVECSRSPERFSDCVFENRQIHFMLYVVCCCLCASESSVCVLNVLDLHVTTDQNWVTTCWYKGIWDVVHHLHTICEQTCCKDGYKGIVNINRITTQLLLRATGSVA